MQPDEVSLYVEPDTPNRNRLTTFFRGILVIPHMIVLYVMMIAGMLAMLIAFFGILFTGKYPASMYRFMVLILRYSAAVSGYAYLLTDRYPPLLGPGPGKRFPVELQIGPPLASYSRARAFFRMIVGFPVMLISGYGIGSLVGIAAILSWFSIVFTGRQSPSFRSAMMVGMSYSMRSSVYLALMTERWPPFLETDPSYAAGEGGVLPLAHPAGAAPPTDGPFSHGTTPSVQPSSGPLGGPSQPPPPPRQAPPPPPPGHGNR